MSTKKEKKYHFIYKTTNILTGRYYFGMHSTNDLDDGYLGSGKRLRYSIRKYGKENHKQEILEFANSQNELIQREREIVNLNEVAKKECLNMMVGGQGGFGWKHLTMEQRLLAAKKTNEKIKMLSETDLEWNKKRSENIRNARIKEYESGEREKKYFYDWTGRKHTIETKKLMSESHIGKHIGSKNSQYGTCWITKDGKNKKIKKEEINKYLNKGWFKGWFKGRKI